MSKLLNFLSGGVVKQVGDVIDNLSTSDEQSLLISVISDYQWRLIWTE